MNADKLKFLENIKLAWDEIAPPETNQLDPIEKFDYLLVAQFMKDGQFKFIREVVEECNDVYVFAKTYRIIKDGLSNRPDGSTLETHSAKTDELLFRHWMTLRNRILDDLAHWFWIRWSYERAAWREIEDGDFRSSIEKLAYIKKPKIGCVTIVVFCCIGCPLVLKAFV